MKKYILFFLFLPCSVSGLYGQDTLTFKACLDLAFANNLALKEAFLEEELSAIQYKSSKMELYPNLNGSISNNNAFGRSIDPYSNSFIDTKFKSYSGSIASNITLFNGFSKINTIKMAKAEVDIQQTAIDRIKDDITIQVASLYTTILYTEELIKSYKEQNQISKQQKDFLQVRFEEGVIAESELFKLDAQIASESVNLITIEHVLKMYYLDLQQLVNVPITTKMHLQTLDVLEIKGDFDDLYLLDVEKTYQENPSFLITKMQEENAKLNIKLSQAAYLPSLNLQLNYGSFYSDSNSNFNFNEQWNNNKNYGFSLSLSIPVFNGFSVRQNVKRAKTQYKQSLVRTDIEKNRLIKVLSQANNDLVASQEKLKSAGSALLFAQKTFEADQLKYEYGKISLTELLLTQKDYFNSQAELIKAKYEYAYNKGVIGFYSENSFSF